MFTSWEWGWDTGGGISKSGLVFDRERISFSCLLYGFRTLLLFMLTVWVGVVVGVFRIGMVVVGEVWILLLGMGVLGLLDYIVRDVIVFLWLLFVLR